MSRCHTAITQETFSLTDRTMKEWLARAYFIATKSGVSGGALADAHHRALGRRARPGHRASGVYARGGHRARVCISISCGATIRCSTISADGWKVTTAPPMSASSVVAGCSHYRSRNACKTPIADLLATVINLKADSPDMMLLIGWLVGALRGLKPYPRAVRGWRVWRVEVVCLSARAAPDRSERSGPEFQPKEARDLMIAALNSHVIGFDNLSLHPRLAVG